MVVVSSMGVMVFSFSNLVIKSLTATLSQLFPKVVQQLEHQIDNYYGGK
jgi:hypothetical protein